MYIRKYVAVRSRIAGRLLTRSLNRVMSGTVGEMEKGIAVEFLRGRTGWSVPVWKGMEGVINDLCIYLRSEGEKEGVVYEVDLN
jgi:hypothetical protein